MLPSEDSYGLSKRIEFLAREIERCRPRRVLDLGCGTGANVTRPLAMRFPQIEFVGADSDTMSILQAREANDLANLKFQIFPAECLPSPRFDLIVASEVLEHVEDPPEFLSSLRGMLADGGEILLTVPNGYGPFEIASLLEAILQVSGLYGALRAVKRALAGRKEATAPPDTHAMSPHVNFFSYAELQHLLVSQGFAITKYQARTFLCGFGLDQMLQGRRLLSWNARIADRLPPQLVSDWMFLLKPLLSAAPPGWRRSRYARWRRSLNVRRLGAGDPSVLG